MVSSQGCMSMPRRAKISQSYLRFWPTLSTPGSSSSGLIAASAACFRNLARAELRLRARTGRRRPSCRRRGGRSARSRLRCRRPRARSRRGAPASDRGWWSRCRSPPRRGPCARATQALSRSSVRTVSYLERSIWRRAQLGRARGGEGDGGEGRRAAAPSSLPPPLAGEGLGRGASRFRFVPLRGRLRLRRRLPRSGAGEAGRAAADW